MPLELNGQPFHISDPEVLKKYSKEFVFTVSPQFVKWNNDPEMHPVDCAPVHIPTFYNHHKMENGLRINLGVLRYYDAVVPNLENGRAINSYTPIYIGIGHTGILKSTDMELNFFLDNSPWNVKVHDDSLHPNYISDAATMLKTFDPVNRADASIDIQKRSTRLQAMFLDEEVYPTDRLRSLAGIVASQASTRKMAHRLFNVDSMQDAPLRTELVRLAMTYTLAMDEIVQLGSTDMTEEVIRWKELMIVEFTAEREWVFHESQTSHKSIIKVPNNLDPVEALVHFLKNNDPYYKWYKPLAARYETVVSRLKKKQKELSQA